jgi:hypothetical protein
VKKYILFAVIITAAALIINYVLGGFKPVDSGLITSEKMIIYGQAYEGRYNSTALDELISELRGQIENTEAEGQLIIVNYLQPELEKRGTVSQFVGIAWDAVPLGISYDSLVLEPYNGAQFRIPVKPLIMPSPEKLKGLAETMANDMNASLAGYSVEQYQDRTLIINFPFKTSD